jgi:hypothetical protein
MYAKTGTMQEYREKEIAFFFGGGGGLKVIACFT